MPPGDVLGIAGALLVAGAAITYLYDIVRGETRPHRVSWLVWSCTGVLGFGAAHDAGAGAGAYVAAVYAVAYVLTFALSLSSRYGKSGGEWYDWPLGLVALAGIVLWSSGHLPNAYAVALAVLCDAIALWPTLRESWRQPASESRRAWTADSVGTLLALPALGHVTFAPAAYPLYLFLATTAVATVLFVRAPRRKSADAVAANS